ncbi:MAG: GNAT family N-acetyltransferase [Tumebacillaceae bacterium]
MEGTLTWTYRLLTIADAPDLLPWYNDRDLHDISHTRPFDPYTLDELIAHWKKKLNRPQATYYALLVDGQVVGRVGLSCSSPGGDMVEYSILIGPGELCGRGLGTEITREMVSVAFAEPKVQVVRLFVRKINARAIRCYEKAGFRHVHSFTQNGIEAVMMQVDRAEWTPGESNRKDGEMQ